MIKGNKIYLPLQYSEKNRAKTIPGSRWSPSERQWSFPINYIHTVKQYFPRFTTAIDKVYAIYLETRKADEVKVDTELREKREALGTWDLDKIIADEWKGKPEPYDPGLVIDKPRYEHQTRMVKAGMIFDKFAYFCEMGTGKTRALLDIILNRDPVKVLIVCPKSVITSWEDEFETYNYKSYEIVKGTKQKRLKILDSAVQSFVINYEGLLSIGSSEIWKSFDMVILDESSRVKNHEAKRTKLIIKAFKDTKCKYILSGTPITQSPMDIYSQFNFLDINFLGHASFYSFRGMYAVMGGFGGYQIIRYKQLDDLKDRLNRHSIQLKKEDCLDLPEKIYQKRIVEMASELRVQYNTMRDQFVVELSNGDDLTASNVLSKMLRLQQISSGSYLEGKANNKIKELDTILDDTGCCPDGDGIRGDGSLVIFARFRASLDLISDLLEKKEIKYGRIDGSVNERTDIIRDFQAGRTNVIVCQEQAAGLGITLHRAHTMVYYENTFSLEDRKQSEDRIHRIGQGDKCTYIDLLYEKTVDIDVLKAISKKQDVATFLVDSFCKGDYKLNKKWTAKQGVLV